MTTVDRTWPLVTVEFAQRNPDRLHILVTTRGGFNVCRGTKFLRRFTHLDHAMTWAQSEEEGS